MKNAIGILSTLLLFGCHKKESPNPDTIVKPVVTSTESVQDSNWYLYSRLNPSEIGKKCGIVYSDTAKYGGTDDNGDYYHLFWIDSKNDTISAIYSDLTKFSHEKIGEPAVITWEIDTFYEAGEGEAKYLFRSAKSVTGLSIENQSQRIQILNSGDIEESNEKIASMNRSNPFGIFSTQSGFQVKDVKIIAREGSAGGEAFSTLDITTDKGKPLCVLSGISNPTLTTIDQLPKIQSTFAFSSTQTQQLDHSRKTSEFIFNNKTYELIREYGEITVDDSETGKPTKSQGYRYSLVSNGNEQLFQTSVSETSRTILWMGDIDNDQKLDLIVSYNKESWGEIGLFLSSNAVGSELLHRTDFSTEWTMN